MRVPGGRLGGPQLAALAVAAKLGNGLVDLTSRANVQIRGLPDAAGGQLASLLADAGLLPSLEHDRARNVLASPVAGRHPRSLAATDAVVAEIDRRLCAEPALAAVPGRFLFAVDDGSGLALDQPADVAVIALDGRTFSLALAGRSTALRLGSGAVATAAVAAAAAFLDERKARGSRAWRIGELPGGAAAVAARMGTRLAIQARSRRCPAPVPGRLTQRDGRVALTALAPLGRLEVAAVAGLAGLAAAYDGEVRISTHRTITFPDIDAAQGGDIERALARMGLVLSDGSGWLGLTACAGLGACPKARVDVRAAAARRAAVRGPRSGAEHWAACERRCGERADQPVSVVALEHGIAVRTAEGERTAGSLAEAVAVLA